jgi:hypothetical protein
MSGGASGSGGASRSPMYSPTVSCDPPGCNR